MPTTSTLRLVYRRGRKPEGLVPKKRRHDKSSFQYLQFPQMIHGRAVITYNVENRVVQKILIKILKEFNRYQPSTRISLADHEGYYNGKITFEVGIANENYFKYLDNFEERMINDIMDKQGPISIIDLLILVKYQIKDQDRHAIRMDIYLTRFITSEYSMEMYLSHEKGIRRMNPDELINMITKELKRQLKAGYDADLKIESIRTA